MGHPVLHLTRMLARRVDMHPVLLAGDRIGDLPLQVKMLLAADPRLADNPIRCTGQCRLGVPARHLDRRQDPGLFGQRLLDVENGRQGLDLAADTPRRHTGGGHILGDDQCHHLTDMLDSVPCQDRFVMSERGKQRVAWNVAAADHPHHATHGQCLACIDTEQSSVSDRAEHGGCMQRAPDLRQIVNVAGLAGELGAGALVVEAAPHHAGRRVVSAAHARAPSSSKGRGRKVSDSRLCRPAGSLTSRQKRCSSRPQARRR